MEGNLRSGTWGRRHRTLAKGWKILQELLEEERIVGKNGGKQVVVGVCSVLCLQM